MAGAHVFPGGRVDPADAIDDPKACCDGLDTVPAFSDLSAAEDIAYRVAATRELVEEVGVLVARGPSGSRLPLDVVEQVRAGIAAGGTLPALAERFALRLALDAFVPLAHWVTPDIEPRRYDTRFFLTTLPEGQIAHHDAGETTELRWMTPADALAQCTRGEILLPPPTWTTLKQMNRASSIDDVYAWARSKAIVRVQPLLQKGAQTILTLPGDPLMPTIPGWEIPEDTRFVLEEGRGWKPIRVS